MLLKHARDVWEEDIDPQCSLHSQSQCSYEHNNKCKQGYFSQKRQKDLKATCMFKQFQSIL